MNILKMACRLLREASFKHLCVLTVDVQDDADLLTVAALDVPSAEAVETTGLLNLILRPLASEGMPFVGITYTSAASKRVAARLGRAGIAYVPAVTKVVSVLVSPDEADRAANWIWGGVSPIGRVKDLLRGRPAPPLCRRYSSGSTGSEVRSAVDMGRYGQVIIQALSNWSTHASQDWWHAGGDVETQSSRDGVTTGCAVTLSSAVAWWHSVGGLSQCSVGTGATTVHGVALTEGDAQVTVSAAAANTHYSLAA